MRDLKYLYYQSQSTLMGAELQFNYDNKIETVYNRNVYRILKVARRKLYLDRCVHNNLSQKGDYDRISVLV